MLPPATSGISTPTSGTRPTGSRYPRRSCTSVARRASGRSTGSARGSSVSATSPSGGSSNGSRRGARSSSRPTRGWTLASSSRSSRSSLSMPAALASDRTRSSSRACAARWAGPMSSSSRPSDGAGSPRPSERPRRTWSAERPTDQPGARRWPGALCPLGDLEEVLGDEAVGLAVDRDRGLTVGRLDEAEDLAGGLVDPVVLVVDAELRTDPDVGLVGWDDIAGLNAGEVVDVDEGCHRWFLLVTDTLIGHCAAMPSLRRSDAGWFHGHGAGQGTAGPTIDGVGATSEVICSLRCRSARRVRVLTVPIGHPSDAAISDWLRPSS